jgi:REP element-mobilizing transposase RayT
LEVFHLSSHTFFHRKSIRLPGYDYSNPGSYFVTLCAHQRACVFGGIIESKMFLSPLGKILAEEWQRSGKIRKEVVLDTYIIMPNHFHAVVHFPSLAKSPSNQPAPGPKSSSLAAMIAGFKSAASHRAAQHQGLSKNPLWQRNYYEHIIRNETNLEKIRDYINANPMFWDFDGNHPDNFRATAGRPYNS